MSHIPVPFAAVPIQLIRSSLSRNAKALFCIIAAYTSVKNRHAYPNINTLCFYLGCNKDSLRLYKAELIAHGWLIQKRIRDKKGRLGGWDLYPQYEPQCSGSTFPSGETEVASGAEVIEESKAGKVEELAAPALEAARMEIVRTSESEDMQVEKVPAIEAVEACAEVSTDNGAVPIPMQEVDSSAAAPETIFCATVVEPAACVAAEIGDAAPGIPAVPGEKLVCAKTLEAPLKQQAIELPVSTETASSPHRVLDITEPQLEDDRPDAVFYIVKDGTRKVGTISREQYLGICWQMEETRKSGKLVNEVGLWKTLLILGVKGRFNLTPYRNAARARIEDEIEARKIEWEKQKAEAATPDQIGDLIALFKAGRLPPVKLD